MTSNFSIEQDLQKKSLNLTYEAHTENILPIRGGVPTNLQRGENAQKIKELYQKINLKEIYITMKMYEEHLERAADLKSVTKATEIKSTIH